MEPMGHSAHPLSKNFDAVGCSTWRPAGSRAIQHNCLQTAGLDLTNARDIECTTKSSEPMGGVYMHSARIAVRFYMHKAHIAVRFYMHSAQIAVRFYMHSA